MILLLQRLKSMRYFLNVFFTSPILFCGKHFKKILILVFECKESKGLIIYFIEDNKSYINRGFAFRMCFNGTFS